ncbi:PAX3- and PAX7-binding protein 1 [Portunus trituberculatus]|uniref:PAX3-and PAX7-binding protein 1 n=1 Tax=Portunus trituberculatus TaxID=210409 RepID=A0A5B7G5G8_PORTR|nr:PAX3- and PAX7-binding protein 1 [Portunus trituberculatus]
MFCVKQQLRGLMLRVGFKSGQIPDANMIHAIRKQRQQAREQGDMIPIDDTVRLEEGKGRLVRDDDNDRSDDEEGSSRMDFAVNQQARDRQQRQEAFNAAQGEMILQIAVDSKTSLKPD